MRSIKKSNQRSAPCYVSAFACILFGFSASFGQFRLQQERLTQPEIERIQIHQCFVRSMFVLRRWNLDAFYQTNLICLIFWFEILPYLLSFHLFDSLYETVDTRLSYTFVNLPAKAVLTTETPGNAPGTKRSTVNPCALSVRIPTYTSPPMRAYR